MSGTSGPSNISPRLQRIAERAKEAPGMAFTTLAHHIDLDLLRNAFGLVRKDGARGVDGQTAEQYAQELEANLAHLLERFKAGTYKAPPVRRVHIPKPGGTATRPIGIPTFEDKVLQKAVAMVLEAIYEQDFSSASYGFRPGRSAHDALQALWWHSMKWSTGWVLEVDIQKFFDTLDHGHLRSFLDRRVRDGVIRRAIDKWLKAGVLEAGQLSYPDSGTPQGGVISPLLANVYLHEVLDVWFTEVVQPRLRGEAHLVRYADDFVIVFAREDDARRVLDVLTKRFGKYGLTLHPDKTRLVPFRRPPASPGSFDFLGFTHHWGRSRTGSWVVRRRTAKGRFNRAVKSIWLWCRSNRHRLVAIQRAHLAPKLRGHYAYYGITGNVYALRRFHRAVVLAWWRWLRRRSQRRMTLRRFYEVLKRYPLPTPRVVQSIYRAVNP